MAAQRPVIGYNWGALNELIVPGETGFLVPYRDLEGVISAIIELCADPQRIHQMGDAGRRQIRSSFSKAALAAALGEGYRRIVTTLQRANGTGSLKTTPQVRTATRPTVVIPVYNAPEISRRCIESVIANTDLTFARVLIINDGSRDPRVRLMLQDFEDIRGIDIHHNSLNQGYTKTVNFGLESTTDDDVVLLNSDTIVTRSWLEGLRAAAYRVPQTGTATAMSDNAGAFSFPTFDTYCPKPAYTDYQTYASVLLHETQHCVPPTVPTGSGFCMYIRRELISECGTFDADAFPQGYGEENDFCMPALKAGWTHVISPWSFVFHVRTASFGSERKQTLVAPGVKVVTTRYPDYTSLVKAAFGAPEMHKLRSLAQSARDFFPD